jgi:hypothetical protein
MEFQMNVTVSIMQHVQHAEINNSAGQLIASFYRDSSGQNDSDWFASPRRNREAMLKYYLAAANAVAALESASNTFQQMEEEDKITWVEVME